MPPAVVAGAAVGSLALSGAQAGLNASANEEQSRLTEQGQLEKAAYIMRAEQLDIEDQLEQLTSLTSDQSVALGAAGFDQDFGRGALRTESVGQTRKNIARLRMNTDQAMISLGLSPGAFEHRVASVIASHHLAQLPDGHPYWNQIGIDVVGSNPSSNYEWANDATNVALMQAIGTSGLEMEAYSGTDWMAGKGSLQVRHRGLG